MLGVSLNRYIQCLYIMLNTKNIDYISRKPFPYMYQDDFLEEEFAKSLQEEILNLYDMC